MKFRTTKMQQQEIRPTGEMSAGLKFVIAMVIMLIFAVFLGIEAEVAGYPQ